MPDTDALADSPAVPFPDAPGSPEDAAASVAFLIPREKFVYRVGGRVGGGPGGGRDARWAWSEAVGKEGITAHLMERGWTADDVETWIRNKQYIRAYGVDIIPHAPYLCANEAGQTVLNTWVEPTLTPEPGTYPTIERVLGWLTDGDEAGQEWLAHWLAAKVQDPGFVPKVAVLFTTLPGGGKGTLGYVLAQMLGPENCAVIQNGALESRFNARWAQKLFVLADEVMTADSYKDVANRLKILIDSATIELEGKGENQRAVKNRLAWMFASNNLVAPIMVEAGDRRYSVFSNHRPITPEHEAMLMGCFEADRSTPTAAFAREISAFYHDLLQLEVDFTRIARPYQNAARDELIEANLSAHELFFRYVDDFGIDGLLERVVTHGDWSLGRTKNEWDFGAAGVGTQIVYQCYLMFCKDAGAKPLRVNRFGGAARKHGWVTSRLGERRSYVYQVRRSDPGPAVTPRPYPTGTPTAPARA